MTETIKELSTGTCILCLKPNVVLSREHVFPDAVGGGLCCYILCKVCNERLGQRVDGPYAKEKHVELARNALRIGGRRDNVPQPFDSIFEITGGERLLRIKLATDFKPEVITTVSKIERIGEGVSLSISVDASKRNTLPGIIRSKLERYFQSAEGIAMGWTAEEIKKVISKTCEGALHVEPTEEPISQMLHGQWTMNPKVWFVEHVKVAYELAAIEFKDEFVGTARAEPIRQFLLSQIADVSPAEWDLKSMAAKLRIVPQLNDMCVEQAIARFVDEGEIHRFHVASVAPRAVMVSMMGMGVVLIDPAPSSKNTPVIYRNDMATQKCHIERGEFIEVKGKATMASSTR